STTHRRPSTVPRYHGYSPPNQSTQPTGSDPTTIGAVRWALSVPGCGRNPNTRIGRRIIEPRAAPPPLRTSAVTCISELRDVTRPVRHLLVGVRLVVLVLRVQPAGIGVPRQMSNRIRRWEPVGGFEREPAGRVR